MAGKYTPGPWFVIDTHPRRAVLTIHYKENVDNGMVASLFINPTTPIEKENDVFVRDEERMANALLIAAAPDLLETLELFVELKETPHSDLLRKAQKVIAKAKGE